MRIGNTEDLNKTGKSDTLINLLQPENQKPLTASQKAKNWWHYHKWYVIAGAFLLLAACSLAGNALGLFHPDPDLQIAYVGKTALPQDTISALQELFTTLAGDYNGDGKTTVQVNQYIRGGQAVSPEAAQYQYASEIALIGDISNCESYLFLLEDPQDFQQEYQLLAAPDGSCPGEADYSTQDKAIRWADCPLLSEAEMGGCTETAAGEDPAGSSQELLKDLYLGRRCFYTDKTVDNLEDCDELWHKLF